MRTTQRLVLLLGALTFCGLGLYAPWEERVPGSVGDNAVGVVQWRGRAWLWSPPKEPDCADVEFLFVAHAQSDSAFARRRRASTSPSDPSARYEHSCGERVAALRAEGTHVPMKEMLFTRLDLTRLALEWMVLGVFVGGVFVALGRRT
ncbi:MAG: hypothetical protein DMD28_00205 [Gemmatimonadetes bacterium]|nr:MAG: hypothetical protein DMD28_00205 [Gemmatimonadota bacterium]